MKELRGIIFSSKLSIQLQSEDTLSKLLPIEHKVTRNCMNIARQIERSKYSATKIAFVGVRRV